MPYAYTAVLFMFYAGNINFFSDIKKHFSTAFTNPAKSDGKGIFRRNNKTAEKVYGNISRISGVLRFCKILNNSRYSAKIKARKTLNFRINNMEDLQK